MVLLQRQQQQRNSLFQLSPSTGFKFQNSMPVLQPSPFPNSQLTTQMTNVAPVPFSLEDRDIQVLFFTTLFKFILILILIMLINLFVIYVFLIR